MISAKFFDDKYYNNAYYARVGGISTKEMNTMELEFLYLVNFKLHVTPEVFEQYKSELITNDAASESTALPPAKEEVVAPVVSIATPKSIQQQQAPTTTSSQAKAVHTR